MGRWLVENFEIPKPDSKDDIPENNEACLGFTSGSLWSLLVMVMEVRKKVGVEVMYIQLHSRWARESGLAEVCCNITHPPFVN